MINNKTTKMIFSKTNNKKETCSITVVTSDRRLQSLSLLLQKKGRCTMIPISNHTCLTGRKLPRWCSCEIPFACQILPPFSNLVTNLTFCSLLLLATLPRFPSCAPNHCMYSWAVQVKLRTNSRDYSGVIHLQWRKRTRRSQTSLMNWMQSLVFLACLKALINWVGLWTCDQYVTTHYAHLWFTEDCNCFHWLLCTLLCYGKMFTFVSFRPQSRMPKQV